MVLLSQIGLLVIFPLLMAYAAASDLLTMTIPNRISLALLGAFGVLAVVGGMSLHAVALHAGAGALVLCVMFACFAFGWIGGGDAKLAAATALWLGFGPLVDYMVLAAVAGGVLTAAVLFLRWAPVPVQGFGLPWLTRLQESKSGVPYGIALAAAALIVYPQSEIWTAAFAR